MKQKKSEKVNGCVVNYTTRPTSKGTWVAVAWFETEEGGEVPEPLVLGPYVSPEQAKAEGFPMLRNAILAAVAALGGSSVSLPGGRAS